MITIKTKNENGYGGAEVKVEKGTPYTTMLVGAEMLIEIILNERPENTIDFILDDIKRIYERDLPKEK